MDKKAKSSEMNVAGKVSFISGIVISLLVIVTGLCFAISCVHIYISGGNRPFTYESIGTHFKYIALPVILTIISVVCGGVLSIIYPIKEKLPTGVSLYAMLKLTYRKKNGIICAESIKHRRYRTYVRLICGWV